MSRGGGQTFASGKQEDQKESRQQIGFEMGVYLGVGEPIFAYDFWGTRWVYDLQICCFFWEHGRYQFPVWYQYYVRVCAGCPGFSLFARLLSSKKQVSTSKILLPSPNLVIVTIQQSATQVWLPASWATVQWWPPWTGSGLCIFLSSSRCHPPHPPIYAFCSHPDSSHLQRFGFWELGQNCGPWNPWKRQILGTLSHLANLSHLILIN